MDYIKNPFAELYVSETIPPEEFVKLFSPFLVQYALALFQPGNVVLKGVQGSGKTMLLSLFEPAIRLAYMDAGTAFPVPEEHRRFISGGINLRHSRAIDFGQRPMHPDPTINSQLAPLHFGDFFNYWVVSDLLETIVRYSQAAGGGVAAELGLETGIEHLNAFACHLAHDECWFGALDGVETFSDLTKALNERIRTYFKYLGFNIKELPSSVAESKTSVGVPIIQTARALKAVGVVPPDVQVFIRVDQYEELGDIAQSYGENGIDFRRVVNRALGMRDATVGYRIGARRYAWRQDLSMFGTRANLEREREYTELDLDEILRRRENRITYVFPRFADDVARRRLQFAGYAIDEGDDPVLKRFCGPALSVDEKAAIYVGGERGCAPQRIVAGSRFLPQPWEKFLLSLAPKKPLAAKLAFAWSQQQKGIRLKAPPPQSQKGKYPWDAEWWKKERKEQALMQLAAGCAQRMVWAGEKDIIELSGGNILVFVSLCRHIWAAWLRARRDSAQRSPIIDAPIPQIEARIQSVGVEEASRYWYGKTTELPGGHSRQRFMNVIATVFQTRLLDDKAMSYPGHNGFSVIEAELENNTELRQFLLDAVDYGDLFDAPHTTKEKDRRPRIKYYLKPVLSPHYRIPVTHTKEPLYVDPAMVERWKDEAEGLRHPRSGPNYDNPQFSIFGAS